MWCGVILECGVYIHSLCFTIAGTQTPAARQTKPTETDEYASEAAAPIAKVLKERHAHTPGKGGLWALGRIGVRDQRHRSTRGSINRTSHYKYYYPV
jgi:hypothetical protein